VPPLINRRPRQKGREPAGWYPAPPTTNAGEIREHWAIRAECLCARRSDPADAVRIHQDKLGPAGVDAQLRSKPTSSNGTAELPWPWMAPFLKAKHDCDRWVAFGRPKRSSGTRSTRWHGACGQRKQRAMQMGRTLRWFERSFFLGIKPLLS
jgi:hypothetical protein